jgi:prophage regulatory protein
MKSEIPTNNHNHSRRVMRMNEVAAKVNLAPSTIYELQSATPPKFPKSFKIVPGGRAAGWFESDIDDWLSNREGVNHGN